MAVEDDTDIPPPPASDPDEDQAKLFAQLVKSMFEEHEKREFAALTRLTTLVDLLVHDARSMHLQVTAQAHALAKTDIVVALLDHRLTRLEEEIRKLGIPVAPH